jgi:hypothetical protein
MSENNGLLPVNIKHLNDIATGLDNMATSSCDTIQAAINRQLKGVEDLIADMVREITALSQWADLIDFNPFSFIKKFIKKVIGPQLDAAIKYAVQLALLLQAVIKIAQAVQRLAVKIIGCTVSAFSRLTAVIGKLTSALKGALANILNIQNKFKAAVAKEVNGVITFVNQAKANAIAEVNQVTKPDNGDGKGPVTVSTPSVPSVPSSNAQIEALAVGQS